MDKDGISKAYINEKMAGKIKILDKQIVKLISKNGIIKVELNIDNIVPDEVVMMYVGWWKKHGNPNFLTHSGISDIGGQITYNDTFIEIMP